jgi:2-polyprenyl-3-methyl-5-hydroxy-6-metoxy-1,4-benzoquinol methylase
MDINTIEQFINTVHQQNNSFIFDFNLMIDGATYLIEQLNGKLIIENSGGSCICFRQVNDNNIIGNYVYKLCIKNNATLNNLAYYINLLHDIIPKTQILYENDGCIIYKQEAVSAITNIKYLNKKLVYEIITLYRFIINKGYKLVDANYLNFGYNSDNVLKLFDIHDFNTLNYDDSLNIVIFLKMFYKVNSMENNDNLHNISSDEVINTASAYLDNAYIDFLKMCKNNAYNDDIYQNLIKTMSDKYYINYQYVYIFDKMIELDSHTDIKYNLAYDLFKEVGSENITSIIDAGCSLGGIALKLAQTFPNIIATCNNITSSELDTAKEIANYTNIQNALFLGNNIMEKPVTTKYDVGLYYAIFHHILRNNNIFTIFAHIKEQVNKYAIIELPFKGDALLDMICNSKFNLNYKVLTSPEIFITYLYGYFKLLSYGPIYYPHSPDLNRYYFKLEVI